VLDVLNSPDFVDLAPAQVRVILLDSGTYLASTSTIYRVLRGEGEVRERRTPSYPSGPRPPRAGR
jgi:putative transposase